MFNLTVTNVTIEKFNNTLIIDDINNLSWNGILFITCMGLPILIIIFCAIYICYNINKDEKRYRAWVQSKKYGPSIYIL